MAKDEQKGTESDTPDNGSSGSDTPDNGSPDVWAWMEERMPVAVIRDAAVKKRIREAAVAEGDREATETGGDGTLPRSVPIGGESQAAADRNEQCGNWRNDQQGEHEEYARNRH